MARILVADDDDQIRAMLREMLERAGHEVIEAPDGSQAASQYRSDPTDLIVTDIIMPVKGGWEAILELRRDFPDIKVIAISGGGKLGPFGYLMLAKRFGARYVFSKPVERDKLLTAVRDILTGESQGPEEKPKRIPKASEKKAILLVDKDPGHTWRLCEGLTGAGHSVSDVQQPQYALEMLERRRFDVALVDVLSAKVGDEDIIDRLNNIWPKPLIIAMADFETLAVRKAVIRRGANHFVDKPVDMDHLLAIIDPPPAFSGQIHGVDILEYIQFMMLSAKRCVLEIRSTQDGTCTLFFDNGNLVHAAGEGVRGEEAFYRCTNFRGGIFVNLPWNDPPEATIDKPGDLLLVEAARRRDEMRSTPS